MELIHSDRKAGGPAVGNLVDEIDSMDIEDVVKQTEDLVQRASDGLAGEPAEAEMAAPPDRLEDALRASLKETERVLRRTASCAKHRVSRSQSSG